MTGTTVIPILVYEDIEQAHDFLVGTFGFTSGGLHRTDDGTVVHAEVRAGDCPIWLHAVTAEHEMASPRARRPPTADSRSSCPMSTRTLRTPWRQVPGSMASRRIRTTAYASTAPATPRTIAGGSPRRSPADRKGAK